ncbi:MAG: hypothetical protein WCY08_06205 [Rhodocyclaceae bacterium]
MNYSEILAQLKAASAFDRRLDEPAWMRALSTASRFWTRRGAADRGRQSLTGFVPPG